MDSCLQDHVAQALHPAPKGNSESLVQEATLARYYSCQALMLRDPGLCQTLAQFHMGSSKLDPASDCRAMYGAYALTLSILKGDPGAVDMCMAMNSASDTRGISSGSERQTCETIVSMLRAGQIGALCDKLPTLMDMSRVPPDRRSQACAEMFAAWSGPRACKAVRADRYADRVVCEDSQALVAGVQAGRIEACGNNALCRAVVVGLPQECDQVLGEEARPACEKRAEQEYAALVGQENSFRRINGLPQYKEGDTILINLSTEERARYQKLGPIGRKENAAIEESKQKAGPSGGGEQAPTQSGESQ